MKRLLYCLIVICLCAGLATGCGKSKIPEDMSEGVYNCGVKAIEVIDQFLKADLTIDEASEKLEDLNEQADALSSDDSRQDLNVCIELNYINVVVFRNLTKSTHVKTTADDVKDARNALASLLGLD